MENAENSLKFDVGNIVPPLADPYKDYTFTLKGSGEILKHKTTLFAENNKYTIIFTKGNGDDISINSSRLSEYVDMMPQIINSPESIKNLKEITSLNELSNITKHKVKSDVDIETTPIIFTENSPKTSKTSSKNSGNIDYLNKLVEKIKFENSLTELNLQLPTKQSLSNLLSIFEFDENDLDIIFDYLKDRLINDLNNNLNMFIDEFLLNLRTDLEVNISEETE